ncbi:methyltransferase [Glaciibacter superstes]|uniref:methyltransferase n=1 Tax=Glaciibacter superstes TaxID=501023 RepID=UPI0003B3146C|nr:class I SAM-dependent methyltransferase [Glaciibacter superstes]
MSSTSQRSLPLNLRRPQHLPFTWTEDGEIHTGLWHSEGGWPAPERLEIIDDRTNTDAAYRLATSGTAMLWRGDFHNARQLLGSLGRRIDRGTRKPSPDLTAAFRKHRADAAHRAQLLGMLLIPLDADYTIPLRRSPDVRLACTQSYGKSDQPSVTSLRELIGVIGAHEWRTNGVDIPALGALIHPHYGVFSPVRGEYLDLVAAAPLPSGTLEDLVAFDIGTGTGVLSAILAHRGIRHVIATDQEPRALACAIENIERLGFTDQVEVAPADLFPVGRADLIVCNPPWIPAEATTSTDHAVYDPDSRMLRGFLGGLALHLEPAGEGWLILSDIAERIGLRSRSELLDLFEDAGLTVAQRIDTRPTHRRAYDTTDPLHAARSNEVTSLWRLRSVNSGTEAGTA